MSFKSSLLTFAMISILTACEQATPTAPNASSVSAPLAASKSVAAPEPLSASAPVSDKASLLERINQKGTIIVATEGDYPPFTFHDKETNELTGYDVEVVRAVAAKLGVKVVFRELKWVGILPGVQSGEFDMAANQISLSTSERQAMFDKAEPYSWSGVAILVREDDNRVKKLEDIRGLYAAQTRTSRYGEMATKAGAVIRPSESSYQSGNLVSLKEADVTLNDSLAVMHHVKQYPQHKLKVAWVSPKEEKNGAGIVLLKGNPEVLSKLNQAMLDLKADGTLKRLGEQFFGEDVSAP